MAAVVEIAREDRVTGPRGQQCFDIRRVGVALRAGQEARAHPDGICASRYQSGRPLGRPDPAGRDHRHAHGREHGGQQLVKWRRPADMAARLHALSDDEVASSRLRGPALADRADLP